MLVSTVEETSPMKRGLKDQMPLRNQIVGGDS